MAEKENLAARDARYGEKMIEIKVRFWTNGVAKEEGKIVPKHAWSGGVVRIKKNKSHAIVPLSPVPFNSLMEIAAAIEKVLIEHDIAIHPSDKMYKYYKCCEN
jgi:hypothetical protein